MMNRIKRRRPLIVPALAAGMIGGLAPLAHADDKPQAQQQSVRQSGAQADSQSAGARDQSQQQPPDSGAQEAGQRQSRQQQAKAQISQEAQAVLDKVRQAYTDLKSLKLQGAMKVSVSGGEQQQSRQQEFTAAFQAPNKFRHELADTLIVGSSAKGLFAYNARSNSFLIADAPNPQAPMKDIPSPVPAILMQQNPSLYMALEKNPLSDWAKGITKVDKAQDVQIDGQSFTALRLQGQGGVSYTMAIDPKTHLVRRITTDLSGALQGNQNQGGVDSAQLVIDYTKVEPGASFPQDHFAWLPPQGAQDAAQQRQAQMKQQDARASQAGQAAPDFSLKSLEGEQVKLSDLKGQVVVLDFWASWCPPCREALPHLGRLYGENQDGVKVLAVNTGEQADAARAFVQAQNLQNLTVLLDPDNSVAQRYGVSSIPTTVVIGPDGKVQRTFVGLGPDTFSEIKQTVSQLKSGDAAVTAGAKQQAGQQPQPQGGQQGGGQQGQQGSKQ